MLSYFNDHRDEVLTWLGYHAWLSAVPVVLGLMISLPLGWLAVRKRWLYAPVVGLAGLLYTIPSIALFVILPDLLGTKILDPINVVAALTIYTIALLVRTVVDGLRSVPDHVRQAAPAIGYRPVSRLLRIELPIAVPVIAAGLRVATVANISLVSVGALIGVGGLGELFTDGFQRNFLTPIVVGVVLSVALALTADAVLVQLQRLLTPWARVAR
jgi:osmoprotectant transport system permease protein